VSGQGEGEDLATSRQLVFLAGSAALGGLALIGLTLHLALAGPVAFPLLMGLGWMLLHGPLALYVAQTGHLDRGYGLSSALLALTLTAVCAQTGGLTSPAVPGFAIVPILAALCGSRLVLLVSGLLGAAGLALLSGMDPAGLAQPGGPAVLAVYAVISLASAVMVADGKKARQDIAALRRQQSYLRQAAEGVVLHSSFSGRLITVSGDVAALLGKDMPGSSGDWLFHLIHRDDRNDYLGALADCHKTGARHELELRLEPAKTTAHEWAETGAVRWVSVTILDAGEVNPAPHATGPARSVLIKLCDVSWKKQFQFAREGQIEQSKMRLDEQASFLLAAAPKLKEASGDIRTLAGLLASLPRTADREAAHQKTVADQILCAGTRLQHVVDGIEETLRTGSAGHAQTAEALDLEQVLAQAIEQCGPLMEGAGLSLDVDKAGALPSIAGNRTAVEQLFLQALLMMVDTSEPGTAAVLTTRREASAVILSLAHVGDEQHLGGLARRGRETGAFRESVITRLCAAQGGESVIVRSPDGKVSVQITLPCPAVRAAPGTAEPGRVEAAGKQALPLRKTA